MDTNSIVTLAERASFVFTGTVTSVGGSSFRDLPPRSSQRLILFTTAWVHGEEIAVTELVSVPDNRYPDLKIMRTGGLPLFDYTISCMAHSRTIKSKFDCSLISWLFCLSGCGLMSATGRKPNHSGHKR